MIRRPMTICAGVVLALAAWLHASTPAEAAAAPPDLGKSKPAQVEFNGIILQGYAGKPGVDYGSELLGQKSGIENLTKAIDVILKNSPFSTKMIRKLQKNGRVVITYHPEFKAARDGLFTLAAFYPHFFKRDDPRGRKDFVVVVGRHGIKWPTNELAMIIVHELVGHGIQHLGGWLEWVREIDLECNANLYGERFYQDIGIDKKSRDVVKFRRALESHWCADFKTYMKRTDPVALKTWDALNPDVPKLLSVFDRYVDALRKDGTAAKAIEASNAERRRKIDEGVRKQARAGDAQAQFELGRIYRDGMGIDANPRKAAEWFYLSALQGNVRAQLNLGAIYANGKGVKRDYAESLKWLRKAAAQGNAEATRLVKKIGAMIKRKEKVSP